MNIKTVGDLQKALAELDPEAPVATVVAKYVDHDDVRPFRSDYIEVVEDPTTPGGFVLSGSLGVSGDLNEIKL